MWQRVSYGLVVIVFLFFVALAFLMIFDCWAGDTFLNSVRKGWFGFIFARLVALSLLLLSIGRFWRSFPRLAALTTGLAVLALVAFCVLKSYSPDGVYGFVGEIEPSNNSSYSPELYHKDHFWRISDGKVQ